MVELPKDEKDLTKKWMYRIKDEMQEQKRYKTMVVINGFAQNKGINFEEIYYLIVKLTSIRIILGIMVVEIFYLEQLDVKKILLHGDLEEEVYIHQP